MEDPTPRQRGDAQILRIFRLPGPPPNPAQPRASVITVTAGPAITPHASAHSSPKSPSRLLFHHSSLSSLPMEQVDVEVDRYLTLLRNKIRQQGFTQLEVQRTLRWGTSYISQLLTKQKGLRLDQVVQILRVIGVEPVEFFRELYWWGEAPGAASATPEQAEELHAQLRNVQTQLRRLVKLLVEKRLVSDEDLRPPGRFGVRDPLG